MNKILNVSKTFEDLNTFAVDPRKQSVKRTQPKIPTETEIKLKRTECNLK